MKVIREQKTVRLISKGGLAARNLTADLIRAVGFVEE
jgi:hypothetical protein